MKFYYLEPEVSGSLGELTTINTSVHPPVVTKLHYEFEGWLGDDILESFPCFIISQKLKGFLDSSSLSGYQLNDVYVTRSDEFIEMYPNKELPTFYWLKITGKSGVDDFSISSDNRLVVSSMALKLLRKGNLDGSEVEML
ncbi:hypothetical protein [Aliivibrio fischeri]|uniref:hypothetical protein n=1 Tax=Aliivibrio fischeri TaxID=668 RepID=UPI003736B10C